MQVSYFDFPVLACATAVAFDGADHLRCLAKWLIRFSA